MEYTIVTVRTEDNGWETDMELPVSMKIKELVLKMLEALKMFDEEKFSEIMRIYLIYNQKKLNEEATLADYQIWDGSVITLRCVKNN